MRPDLSVGTTAELVWHVAAEHTIHLGYPPPSLRQGLVLHESQRPATSVVVFSTPNMILLMERAARKVLEPYLEAGEESVGAMVQVEHLAGTPIGSEVRGVATVTAINGRLVEFDIAAYDRHEQIGRGTHRRAVVRLDRVAQRIHEKAAGIQASTQQLSWMDGIATLPAASQTASSPSQAVAMNSNRSQAAAVPRMETLELEISGPLATVTLNRPEKKNAVNTLMTAEWEQLNHYLLTHPEIRIVVVKGAGGSFCAGDDVPEVGTLTIEQARQLSYRQARIYLGWEQLPQVFIAMVDGEALGAGCVAAAACDFRIASHGARFGMPEILLGWPPGYGVAQLTALIGKSRALEMCLLGSPISARQAHQWGLVHRLTAANSLLAETQQWVDALLALPTDALRETKRLVHADEGLQPKTAFLADTAAYIRCLDQPAAREGITAFQQKRPPRYHA
ncbi:thioesterase, FlK family [Planctomycetaceae bacterium SH139]